VALSFDEVKRELQADAGLDRKSNAEEFKAGSAGRKITLVE
jgi:hypothetical protein